MPKTTLLAVVGHVQWSGVCILVIAHLCVSSYVRWASNGNMKQPLGVLVAGHFASEKNTTFFCFCSDASRTQCTIFSTQEMTIEHMLASERLSEHSGAWVKQNHHSLYHFNCMVCVVATELALVQCFAIRFLTNPKTIMQ